MKCQKCDGTGKREIEKEVSMTTKVFVKEDCDICMGTGELPDDITPLILERLDRIIQLLEGFQTR